jgi:glycosyltransferase involved in cell wall biosynthesis
MTNITVIIPALNEAGNIRQLVQDVKATLPVQVIVVDNGSTDGTAAEAQAGGARVVSEPRRGYGYACAAGVAATEAEALAFMDGDNSFLPSELPALLAPLLAGKADLVLGSRALGCMEKGAMPPHQRFGNWFAARMMGIFYGVKLSDLGPYRAVRRSLLLALEMREMTYGWPVEMMTKAARRGARIVEVPVTYQSRRSGHSKVGGTIRGSLLAAWFIVSVMLRVEKGVKNVPHFDQSADAGNRSRTL